MKGRRRLFPMLGFGFFPLTAASNAGTPLIWASMLHMVYGNAMIGLLEGLLLAS